MVIPSLDGSAWARSLAVSSSRVTSISPLRSIRTTAAPSTVFLTSRRILASSRPLALDICTRIVYLSESIVGGPPAYRRPLAATPAYVLIL